MWIKKFLGICTCPLRNNICLEAIFVNAFMVVYSAVADSRSIRTMIGNKMEASEYCRTRQICDFDTVVDIILRSAGCSLVV